MAEQLEDNHNIIWLAVTTTESNHDGNHDYF